MSDFEVINHRLDTAEADIKTLYKKVNDVTLSQVSSNTKLDSMLLTLGEMKESIEFSPLLNVKYWKFYPTVRNACKRSLGSLKRFSRAWTPFLRQTIIY